MGPDHGVLGATFKATRALQVASMLAVIGITANFISEMVSAGATPPPVLVAILSIVCVVLAMAAGGISTNVTLGLHCRAVLCHHRHSLFRQHPASVNQHWRRLSFLDYPGCRLGRRGQATVLPQLQILG